MEFFGRYLDRNERPPGAGKLTFSTLGTDQWQTVNSWPPEGVGVRRWYPNSAGGLAELAEEVGAPQPGTTQVPSTLPEPNAMPEPNAAHQPGVADPGAAQDQGAADPGAAHQPSAVQEPKIAGWSAGVREPAAAQTVH